MDHKYLLRAWSTALALTTVAFLGAGCGGKDSSGPADPGPDAIGEESMLGEALVGVADGKFGDPSVEAAIEGIGTIVGTSQGHFYHVNLKDGVTLLAAQNALSSADFTYVEPNYKAHTLAAPTPASENFPYTNALVQGQVASAWSAWGWTPASATVTSTASAVDDTVTVNGVQFKAIANGGTPTAVLYPIGTGGTKESDTATNLAAAINASTDPAVNGVVRASASGAAVTLTAVKGGASGNTLAIAATGGMTASAAFLSGGGIPAASLKVKLTSVAVDDAIVINGATFTAKAAAAVHGSQLFDQQGNDAADAASLADQINNSVDALIQGKVNASVNSNIVTLTWAVRGTAGNLKNVSGANTFSFSDDGVTWAAAATTLKGGGSAATARGTVTLTSVVATDTIVINGATFTAKSGAPTASEVDYFDIGASDNAATSNLATAIQTSKNPRIVGTVTASATGLSNILTLTALTPGAGGNKILVSQTGGNFGLGSLNGGYLLGGSGRVLTIAVVDTGVQGSHEDLTGKVLPGYNAIDPTNPGSVTDADGHGTQVAGIAAARINNGVGISGVAAVGNVGNAVDTDYGFVQIVPVKVSDASHVPTHASIAKGINWATNLRSPPVDVVLVSLGSGAPSWTLQKAVENAFSAKVLVVAAAGNSGTSLMKYPAAYQGTKQKVLSVASVDASDALSSSATFASNYGSWVNVAAPGEGLTTTTIDGCGSANQCYATNGAAVSGTSFSASFVAGAAALVWSAYPSLTADQLRTLLIQSVDPITLPKGKVLKANAGRLNVQAAMSNAANAAAGVPDPLVPAALLFDSTVQPVGGTFTGTVLLTGVVPTTATAALNVTLSSSDATVVSVPSAPITIAKGSATSTFKVTALKNGSATITATPAGSHGAVSYTLTVQVPGISSIALSKSSVVGGTKVQGTVTLNAAATADVTLVIVTGTSATDYSVVDAAHTAAVPDVSPSSATTSAIKVLKGQKTAKFDIVTNPVAGDMLVKNSAPNGPAYLWAYDKNNTGVKKVASLEILAPAVATITYSAASTIVWDSPGSTGGITGTVTLTGNAAALSPVTVYLAPSDSTITLGGPNVTVASGIPHVVIPAGSSTVTFAVQPEPVATATSFTVTGYIGTYDAKTNPGKLATFKVNPALTGFAVSPSSVSGDGTVTGTITLAAVAPVNGADVTVTVDSTSCNSSSAASSPVHLTGPSAAACTVTANVQQGQKTTTVPISIKASPYPVAATVTASFLGVDKSATVTSSAPVLSSIAFANSTVKSVATGNVQAVTVTLGSAAVASTTIDLTIASGTATTIKTSLTPVGGFGSAKISQTIAAGQSTATFYVQGILAGSDTLSAVVNGSTAAAKTLKVTVVAPTSGFAFTVGGQALGASYHAGAPSADLQVVKVVVGAALSTTAATPVTVQLVNPATGAVISSGTPTAAVSIPASGTASGAFNMNAPSTGTGLKLRAILPTGEYTDSTAFDLI